MLCWTITKAQLSLPTLTYRRIRGDLIELYKIMHGIYSSDACPKLELNCLYKRRSCLTNTRKKYFSFTILFSFPYCTESDVRKILFLQWIKHFSHLIFYWMVVIINWNVTWILLTNAFETMMSILFYYPKQLFFLLFLSFLIYAFIWCMPLI